MKKLAKLTGALAVVALFAASAITTTNAKEVSMDDINVSTTEALNDMVVKDTWVLVSRDFVLAGSRD